MKSHVLDLIFTLHASASFCVRLNPSQIKNHARVATSRRIRQGGPTRTSADVSVPRFAGFSLIT